MSESLQVHGCIMVNVVKIAKSRSYYVSRPSVLTPSTRALLFLIHDTCLALTQTLNYYCFFFT